MKHLVLLLIGSCLLYAADAQSRKTQASGNSKKNAAAIKASQQKEKETSQKTGIARAEAEKLENEKKIADEAIEKEKLAKEKLEQERLEKEKLELEKKKIEKEKVETERKEKELREKERKDRINKGRDEVNKAAGLNDAQGQQVSQVNQEYHNRARAIRENSSLSDAEKKDQLYDLNKQRQASIENVVGKSKAQDLEKSRKEQRVKNKEDKDEQWLDEIEGHKKAKKSKAKRNNKK